MSGRSNRSARVVIMDDVDWSEPAPRGHRAAAELDLPDWMQPALDRAVSRTDDGAVVEYSASDWMDESDAIWEGPVNSRRQSIARAEMRWERAERAERDEVLQWAEPEPAVVEYTGDIDEEELWGPRPKLLADAPGGRRTVVITGRVADRYVAPRGGARDSVPVHARYGFKADRTAMWAVLLCVILLLVAITSGH